MFLMIRRVDENNIGDGTCGPNDYFPLDGKVQDIYADKFDVEGVSHIVLGGGGLFHDSFEEHMERILKLDVPIICWGAGTNFHGVSEKKYGCDLSRFALLGLRDSGDNFVPCVSCMSPLLVPKSGYGVVTYMHKDARWTKGIGLPYLVNNCKSLEKVIKHLNFGDTVVTNTYHGYYWSVLLGKRVVLYKPFSSKFYHVPWKVPIVHTEDELPDVINGDIPTYPNALEECRERSREFYERVSQLCTTSKN